MPCGTCRHCEKGLEDHCETFFQQNRLAGHLFDGTTRYSRDGEDVAMYSMGGHARSCVVPGRAVFPLPNEVPLHDAAILGCSLFTGYGAVRGVADVQPGENVAVVATGGVGLSIIHLARAAGAQRVIAVDIDDTKLALAAELGATDVINSATQDAADEVRRLLGHGVDVAFEALGSVATVSLAVDLLDDGGRAIFAGIAPAGQTLDVEIAKLVRRKLRILGSFGAPASTTMPEVIRLAAEGKIDLERLITDRFAFEETAEAYRKLNEREIRGRGVVMVEPELG